MSGQAKDLFLSDFSEELKKESNVIAIDEDVKKSVETDCQSKINGFAVKMSEWRENSLYSSNFAF